MPDQPPDCPTEPGQLCSECPRRRSDDLVEQLRAAVELFENNTKLRLDDFEQTIKGRVLIVEQAIAHSSEERGKLLETDQRVRSILDAWDKFNTAGKKHMGRIFIAAAKLALAAILVGLARVFYTDAARLFAWIGGIIKKLWA